MYQDSKSLLELNNNVLVPKYFWKVVCDPMGRSSIAFYAVNPDGWDGVARRESGCLGYQVSLDCGLVYCVSLESLKKKKVSKDWNLPSLADTCNPSTRGDFLDQYLRNWQ